MEICKAPTLQLKALNKHSITHTMYTELKKERKKLTHNVDKGSSITMQKMHTHTHTVQTDRDERTSLPDPPTPSTLSPVPNNPYGFCGRYKHPVSWKAKCSPCRHSEALHAEMVVGAGAALLLVFVLTVGAILCCRRTNKHDGRIHAWWLCLVLKVIVRPGWLWWMTVESMPGDSASFRRFWWGQADHDESTNSRRRRRRRRRRKGGTSGVFMYLVLTRMPSESYRWRLRCFLLCLCGVFRAPVNSFVRWFY